MKKITLYDFLLHFENNNKLVYYYNIDDKYIELNEDEIKTTFKNNNINHFYVEDNMLYIEIED